MPLRRELAIVTDPALAETIEETNLAAISAISTISDLDRAREEA